MKKVAFTICSNNYLAAAKVLVESFKKFHLDFDVYIGLVDKKSELIDYSAFGATVLLAEDISMPDIDELSQKFNIVELNTTVKPFYFKHFFFSLGATQAIYLDPDIQVFSPLTEVMYGLSKAMVTLTPHMLSPVDDQYSPNDKHILPTGMFNLGFVALASHSQLSSFLDWWADRCVKYGFRRDSEGLFYDQIWINYVPCFFESYYIIRDVGYNVANWNLHERALTRAADGTWWVNAVSKLAFFHFSHYNINKPEVISSYNSRFTFENRPDLLQLFKEYRDQILANDGIHLRAIIPHYKEINNRVKALEEKQYYTFKRKIINKVSNLLERVIPG
ncbi:MAG TPA: glycosyl transferase [Cytophagaceae bacterium]|jgi:hypothetical protein